MILDDDRKLCRYILNYMYFQLLTFSKARKGVLSEHEHFPSSASGQSNLEYKCAYLCIYITIEASYERSELRAKRVTSEASYERSELRAKLAHSGAPASLGKDALSRAKRVTSEASINYKLGGGGGVWGPSPSKFSKMKCFRSDFEHTSADLRCIINIAPLPPPPWIRACF